MFRSIAPGEGQKHGADYTHKTQWKPRCFVRFHYANCGIRDGAQVEDTGKFTLARGLVRIAT